MGDGQSRKKQGRDTQISAAIAKLKRFLTPGNQRILFLLTIIFAVLSIWDVVKAVFPGPVSMAIYVCAAVCFFPSCALWIRLIRVFFQIVLIPFTERNEILNIFIRDFKLRTVIMALPGVGVTMVFAGYNAFLGISRLSAWYGSLAAYYILMCAMRLISVLYAKSIYIDKRELTKEQREWRVYKNCGIMLSIMSLALLGAVIMLVAGQGEKSYPGLMIYVMAAYTFYKLTLSILNMIKAMREHSPLLIALRNIGTCEALVALLSLQSALFAKFGADSGTMIPVMNGVTGGAVCLICLGLGINMVYKTEKTKKALEEGAIYND